MPLPGPDAPPGWYRAACGQVLRWWTGAAWGPDVAPLGADPVDPPPRPLLPGPGEVATSVLVVPATEVLRLE